MNNKGFANIILIVLVVSLIGAAGYLTLGKKSTNQPPIEQSQNTTPTESTYPNTSQTPSVQNQQNGKGAIVFLSVHPCQQGQYFCTYAYGAKAVLLGKNIASAVMRSSGVSGSGAVPFDEVIGKLTKVSQSANGDRIEVWESNMRTGLQGGDNFYVEAKDSQGNTLKSQQLHLHYTPASNLTIISPQRDEELQRGSAKEIKWSISNPPKNSWVRIKISKVPEGQTLLSQEAIILQKDVPSNSSFTWNIPSNLEARRYEMRVDLYGEAYNSDTWIKRSFTDFVVR